VRKVHGSPSQSRGHEGNDFIEVRGSPFHRK